ncbi:hypothetical protein N7478_001285 [Penicillium angulare]|uniref:uncharacterized protein n=1 Tax=Penicillium angulare TaxID=116970 RepID=UPI0025423694|nr:uncharacterized protein N7478_001285 [Penicillium angulare]KAJ5292034.1 hypothetical protein N7478_001285 [Penicillium angulare]
MKATTPTYICEECNTRLRIETIDYETNLALIITKWIEIGPGLSPDDPQWMRHAGKADNAYLYPDSANYHLSNGKSDARSCFENAFPLNNGSPQSLEVEIPKPLLSEKQAL